jgi:hypothetical protein
MGKASGDLHVFLGKLCDDLHAFLMKSKRVLHAFLTKSKHVLHAFLTKVKRAPHVFHGKVNFSHNFCYSNPRHFEASSPRHCRHCAVIAPVTRPRRQLTKITGKRIL